METDWEPASDCGTTPNICIIGAGFSGLTAGIQLKRKLNLSTFTIYDENHEVGGTWLVNTYPGCACDVQSHLYSWSFEPNPDWSQTFSSQDEIWTYMMATAAKYELYQHIQFSTQVQALVWNEVIQKWRVTVLNKDTGLEETKLFDIVINGPGVLRLPNLPKEFRAFKGPIIHSAEWDSTVELEGKAVGIVGSGASAIQIIPSIAPDVKELHSFQRKPAWVSSRRQFEIPRVAKWIFRKLPLIMWFYRCLIFLVAEFLHLAFVHKSIISKLGANDLLKYLKREVPDPDLRRKLRPNYPFGCKRVTIANDYYPALRLPHVKVHSENIIGVTSDKILTANGTATRLDVLILATGFKVSDYFEPMRISGKGTTDVMSDWWYNGPKLLLGICGSNLPNHFIINGPNTSLGHSSVIFMIECQVNFAVDVIEEMMERSATSVCVKAGAVDKYMKDLHKRMKRMVWGNEQCGSWYSDRRGVITALWPWNCITYWNRTRKVNFHNFDFYRF